MTQDQKFKKIMYTFILWFVGALIMTVAYTYLKKEGFIWDNEDGGSYEMVDCDTYTLIQKKEAGLPTKDCKERKWVGDNRTNPLSWNTRKVIFCIAGLFWFILACVRIGLIANTNPPGNG